MMTTVSEIMTRQITTVSPETSVQDIAELLSTKRFGAVPVVDAEDRVLGMVTEDDLATRAAPIHLPRYIPFLGGIVYLESPQHFAEEAEKILAMTAGEIMEKRFEAISPDTPVAEVAARMINQDIRRLLILDDTEHLLGIVTRADIVRMQMQQGQLREDA